MSLRDKKFGIFSAVVIAAALTLTGCSSSDSATSESASCAKADLATVTEGKLTIATGEPAYYPWIIDDAPETGNGFEGAVAYAVAKQLGFDAADVEWVRTTFDSASHAEGRQFDPGQVYGRMKDPIGPVQSSHVDGAGSPRTGDQNMLSSPRGRQLHMWISLERRAWGCTCNWVHSSVVRAADSRWPRKVVSGG